MATHKAGATENQNFLRRERLHKSHCSAKPLDFW
jgi:hypothetical protein